MPGKDAVAVGAGHYHETYEKVGGAWLIKTSTLTRLREDVFNAFVSVYVSDRIKRVAAAVAQRLGRREPAVI